MRIHFERTGGFAGMLMTTTVDTDSLSSEVARELRDMVHAAAFFDLSAAYTTTAPGADRFQYKLTVEDEGQRHTVEVSEAAAPEALRPLLQRLTAMARATRHS